MDKKRSGSAVSGEKDKKQRVEKQERAEKRCLGEKNDVQRSSKKPKQENLDLMDTSDEQKIPELNPHLKVFSTPQEIEALEKNILMKAHYDGIAPTDDLSGKRKDRIQGFVQFQNTPSDDTARSTVFIRDSQKYLKLFQTYADTYLGGWKPLKIPCFMQDLKLNDFNKRLSMLKKNEKGDTKLEKWRAALSQEDIDESPKKFVWMMPKFESGDLIAWKCGMIHAVLGAKKANLVRLKIYQDIYSVNPLPLDESGFVASDGGQAKNARIFEIQRAKEINGEEKNIDIRDELALDSAGRKLLRLDDTGASDLGSEKKRIQTIQAKQLVDDIKYHGISVIRNAVPEEILVSKGSSEKVPVMRSICDYFQTLMKLPEGVDLMDTHKSKCLYLKNVREELGITNKHLRRNASNSYSVHLNKANGSSRYGSCCKTAVAVSAYIAPLFEAIWKQEFGDDVSPKCYGVDLSLQAPVS